MGGLECFERVGTHYIIRTSSIRLLEADRIRPLLRIKIIEIRPFRDLQTISKGVFLAKNNYKKVSGIDREGDGEKWPRGRNTPAKRSKMNERPANRANR
jgi:hypothetical protein